VGVCVWCVCACALPTHRYAFSFITALQSTDSQGIMQAIGCCKHAAAYSLDNFTSSNGTKVTRMEFNAVVSDHDMQLTCVPLLPIAVPK